MTTTKTTHIHAYTKDDVCLGTFALTSFDGQIAYGHLAWLSTNTEVCTHLCSSHHAIVEAGTVGMLTWFQYPGRCNGDKAPDRLIEALNGGITLVGVKIGVAKKCTCGTSRSPGGGLHLGYCDGFAGRGCAGSTGIAGCSCCR